MPGALQFGSFEFDPQARALRKAGLLLRVPNQSLEILALLLECPGHVVSRDAICDRLWPTGTIVDFDHSVSVAVRRLREALSDSADTPRFIQTLPRRGYRFLAAVSRATGGAPEPRYRMVREAGRGGMGVVYQAQDLQLDRVVALKFLPQELAGDPDALGGLRREAQSLAALNHPGISTLYGIEEHEGRSCLVMEFIEGRTLGSLLEQGALDPRRAVEIAIQVADALEGAHRAGIVHRDLKPGNIMLTADGRAKILDFGMAALAGPAERRGGTTARESAGARTVAHSEQDPSEDARSAVAEPDRVSGTPAYMSPEQAEGKAADHRSDIFSFGSVLYETLTGRPPFKAGPGVSTLEAVRSANPRPIHAWTPGIPAKLEGIVARCLRKDPERRFQHMVEVKVALEEAKRTWEPARRLSPRRLAYVLAAIGLVACAAASVSLSLRGVGARSKPPVLTRLTSDPGLSTTPAISPDGKLFAYASDRGGQQNMDIWMRAVAGGDPVQLTSHPADESEPSFSADSMWIAFRSERDGGGIWVKPVRGGDERLVARHARAPRFSPHGAWIAFEIDSDFEARKIGVVSLWGGPVRQIAREFDSASAPIWSGDGKHVLCLGRKGPLQTGDLDWWAAPVEGGAAVRTGALELLRKQGFALADPLPPHDWVGGQVLFSAAAGSARSLWRLRISPRTLRAEGAAAPVTLGTGQDIEPSAHETADGALRVVFASHTAVLNIWSLHLDANRGRPSGDLRRVTEDAAANGRPVISANGKAMAFVTERSGNPDIWYMDLDTGQEKFLAATPDPEHHPVMSRDGSEVVYSVGTPNRPSYAIPTAGGQAERLCEDCFLAEDLSSDRKKLLFGSPGPSPNSLFSVFLLDRDSGKRSQLLSHPKWHLWGPRFSPDGKWVSFYVAGCCAYVAPFRESATVSERDWVRVISHPAMEPRWSPDGSLLYYLANRDGFVCLWAQRLNPATKHPQGEPFAVYHSHSVRRSLGGGFDEYVTPSVGRNRIFLTQNEVSGNVWLADLPTWK